MASLLNGQEVAYEHLRVGREVPFNTLYGSIQQDQEGFLWMGTDKGIYRYDGQQFRRYPMSADIISAEILACGFTDDGTLWGLSYSKQIVYLTPDADTIHSLDIDLEQAGATLDLLKIEGQALYFSYNYTHGGKVELFELTFPPHSIEAKRSPKRIQKQSIDSAFRVVQIPDGSLMAYYSRNRKDIIVQHYKDGQTQQVAQYATPYQTTARANIRYLKNVHRVAIASGVNRGLPTCLIQAEAPYDYHLIYPTDFKRTIDIFDDRDGNIWLCTDNGLYAYNADGQHQDHISPLLTGKVINTLFQDQEGSYWIGTERNGLYYIPNLEARYYAQNNSALAANNITALIQEDQEQLFGGTQNSHLFRVQKGEVHPIYTFDIAENRHLYIRNLKYYQNKLIAGLGQVYIFDLNDQSVRPSPMKWTSKDLDLHQDLVYTAGINGAAFFPPIATSTLPQKVSEDRTISIWKDRYKPLIWIGEMNQLQIYDMDSDSLYPFLNDQAPFSYFINDIVQDQEQRIWVGTATDGLYAIQNEQLIHHFTTEDGLLGNNCRNLVIDDKQQLWVGTDHGVNRLWLDDLRLESIDRADGLLVEEVSALSRLKDELWVGTSEGLFSIPIKENFRSSHQPRISLNHFLVGNQDWGQQTSYQLNYDENNLDIEFQGLDYQHRQKLRYRYRMIGMDSTWTLVDKKANAVRFAKLPPGQYQFEVQAINGEGQYS
ncbi:MAG: two-component regulator propeller domain-containing protein, partial [Bacteroidota bacterium]